MRNIKFKHISNWRDRVDIWQKPTQYSKAIIFQLKIKKFVKRKK